MASTRAVWGIDIGQCALKALRVRAVGDKLEILAHEYIEHEKILSQPDADRRTLVSKALEQFLSKHDLRQDYVVIGVPGQHTLSRFTKLPPVEMKKIPEIVQFEAHQQIPFDLDEVIWDYQTFANEETKEVEVGIFAMRRELVAEHLHPFVLAGVEPIIVQSSPLSMFNALKFDGVLTEGATLIIDIGAQNTDLIVSDRHSVWTRNLPLGGNNFTEALLKAFKIAFAKAESLKRSAASSKYARQIFQAMRPVFADLVSEVQRSMGFYSSTHRGARVTRVVAMGNAFKLPGLQKFLQSNLGIEVIRPTTFNKLSTASVENTPQLVEHLLSYGVAYGLALQGTDQGDITSNLLPPEIARGIVWRKKVPWFWGAAASVAFAATLVWGRYLWDSRAIASATGGSEPSQQTYSEEEARRMLRQQKPDANQPPIQYAAQVRNLAASFEKIDQEYSSKGSEEQNKINQIIALQRNKLLWPRMLQDIHAALPQPQPALAAALEKGAAAYVEAIRKGGAELARGDRKQVFITSLSSIYTDNVNTLFTQLRGTGIPRSMMQDQAQPQGGENAPQTNGPGFVIRINGYTPNKSGTRFLEQELLKNLARIAPPPAEPQGNQPPAKQTKDYFFVVNPTQSIVSCSQGVKLSERTTRTDMSGGTGLGGMGGIGGGGLGKSTNVQSNPDMDPLTGEPLVNDWAFEILFQVVLVPQQNTEQPQ